MKYVVEADGNVLYAGPDRVRARTVYNERVHRNYEGHGDDNEDVIYYVNGKEARRFGLNTFRPNYFEDVRHAGARRRRSRTGGSR